MRIIMGIWEINKEYQKKKKVDNKDKAKVFQDPNQDLF